MALQTAFSTENGTLTVLATGVAASADDVRQLVDDITAEAEKDRILLVICDTTRLQHRLGFTEILQVGKLAVARAAPRQACAGVHSE